MKIKVVFFGTPDFAAEVLHYLLDHGVDIVAAVTQPDRPKGRSLQLTPSPVKTLALSRNIPVFQPEKASNETFLQQLAALKADLFVVVVFGQILSQKLLDIPPLGSINVHPSLLPKFRGAAPVHRSLMAGVTETGVSIQKIVKQLDAGDVLAVAKMGVPPDMIFGELEPQLLELSKPLLLGVIHKYEHGVPPATPQDPALATYASKFELDELEIRWDKPAAELHNLIRAFSPRPGAWCWIRSGEERKRLKILRTQIVSASGSPGQILSNETVACGHGALRLLEVQPEGKKIMKAADWLRGQKNISF
ncbi:MAG TPA: methionyl-tRNA formyltransferase [Chlamydiales bacterium]|nr:methionyl-tRNA formyltransferase [Chlamydiales bacterium]